MSTIGNTAAPRRRRINLAIGAIGLAALVAAAAPGLGAGGPAVVAAARTATIEIDNFAFAPTALSVTAGTTVTWKNADDSPHRVAAKDGTFTSAALDTDDSFSHTFAAPGEYSYICSIHPYMVGKIIVKPAAPRS